MALWRLRIRNPSRTDRPDSGCGRRKEFFSISISSSTVPATVSGLSWPPDPQLRQHTQAGRKHGDLVDSLSIMQPFFLSMIFCFLSLAFMFACQSSMIAFEFWTKPRDSSVSTFHSLLPNGLGHGSVLATYPHT